MIKDAYFKLLYFFLILVLSSCWKEQLYYPPKPIILKGYIPHKTQNLVIISLDGFRWEEVFRGADSSLLFDESYTSIEDDWLRDRFWSDDISERRAKLLPFVWTELASNGKIYGNRDLGNRINVSNPYRLSYAGYNEMFTGYVDYRINSNGYGENPNFNFFEFANQQKGFEGTKVGAVCGWKKFDNIFNVSRNGLNLIAGSESNGGIIDYYSKDSFALEIKKKLPSLDLYSVAGAPNIYDKRVYTVAKAYLERYRPRLFYISFFGTDLYGHRKKYDSYLIDAYNVDRMIGDIWKFLQSESMYREKTTLFVTCDHGRGTRTDWKEHGPDIAHSDETWFAVIGPDTRPGGEIKTEERIFQKQFVRSFAAFLGWDISGVKVMGKGISDLMDGE